MLIACCMQLQIRVCVCQEIYVWKCQLVSNRLILSYVHYVLDCLILFWTQLHLYYCSCHSTSFRYSPLTLFLSLIHKLSMTLVRLQALWSGNHLRLQLSVCLWRFNATMCRTLCFPIFPVHWQSSVTLHISLLFFPVTIYCYYYYYFISLFLSLSFNYLYHFVDKLWLTDYAESQSISIIRFVKSFLSLIIVFIEVIVKLSDKGTMNSMRH